MPSDSSSSVCRVVFFPRAIFREISPVSRDRSISAFSSVLLPTPLCPVRQQSPPPRIISLSSSRPVPSFALTGITGIPVLRYSRSTRCAAVPSRSVLFTAMAARISWAAARESCLSTSSISASGTGAITMISRVTFATGGRRHSVFRGRISSSHPCSSPCPGEKSTSSPARGLIRSRLNFFLHRRVYSSPSGVRTV